MKIVYETSETRSKYQHLHCKGPRRRRRKKKGAENVFEEITAENFLSGKVNRHLHPGSTENPNQNKHKEVNTNTN